MRRDPGYQPLLLGVAMIGLGLAARRVRPDALSLPESPGSAPRKRDVRSAQDAAHVARDGIAGFIPDNIFGSLGRTLMIMGSALIAVRALDELVDKDAADY